MKTIHITCISKTLIDLCFTKQGIKTKTTFAKVFCNVVVVKMCCQSIKQFVWAIPVPFKIYADFECNLKSVESYDGSYSKYIKITFLVVLLTKLFVLMMNLLSQ